jgi:hypothetical protein
MVKRRHIKQFLSFHRCTRGNFECVLCEQLIQPTMEYSRRVYALSKRLEVERSHESPDCSELYHA